MTKTPTNKTKPLVKLLSNSLFLKPTLDLLQQELKLFYSVNSPPDSETLKLEILLPKTMTTEYYKELGLPQQMKDSNKTLPITKPLPITTKPKKTITKIMKVFYGELLEPLLLLYLLSELLPLDTVSERKCKTMPNRNIKKDKTLRINLLSLILKFLILKMMIISLSPIKMFLELVKSTCLLIMEIFLLLTDFMLI